MQRREFIAGLCRMAAAWPLAAHAQQANLPVIGYLSGGSADGDSSYVTALRQGLGQGGYAEGRNVEILFHFAENQFSRLPALASDLVRRRVAVIVASGAVASVAAKAATAT